MERVFCSTDSYPVCTGIVKLSTLNGILEDTRNMERKNVLLVDSSQCANIPIPDDFLTGVVPANAATRSAKATNSVLKKDIFQHD